MSRSSDLSGRQSDTNFRTLELFLSDGFSVAGRHGGGYFVDDVAVIRGGSGGDLGNAFVAIPVAGKHGQYALTVGQFSPMMYQYDPINSLTQSLPAALVDGVDDFSFANSSPGVRLDYFDNRGAGTANGNYLTVGMPLEGHLSLNQDSRLYGPRGVFVHGFRRWHDSSWGAFAYVHSRSDQEGLAGTYRLRDNLYLLGVGTLGHDEFSNTQQLSLEANYIASPELALTVRGEASGGSDRTVYPVLAATYYPFHQSVLRLTGETIQAKGSRSAAIFIFGQF